MLIRRLQFMKEDYKEDLTIYQQQLSQVLQSLAPSFQNPRYTHARDPNERNKKLLKKVSQVISGYLTRFGKSYVHLVFLLQKFFSMGAPTNNGARGPPTAKSGPVDTHLPKGDRDSNYRDKINVISTPPPSPLWQGHLNSKIYV